MVQLGEMRIKITTDDDFDHTFKGWDESIRDDVRQALDNGTWEAYEIMIQRAVPGSWETVESLCGSVHTSGLCGVYSFASDIPEEQMRDTVREMYRNV